MTCRYCDRPRIKPRSCGHHDDVCAKCHEYLWCDGKPPKKSERTI